MALTLEQEMIKNLQDCVVTSQLKSNTHVKLNQAGYLNRSIFSAEAWSIRQRNEVISKSKRTYLSDMVPELQRNHNFYVELAQTCKAQYKEDLKEKTKVRVVEEINLQIQHFHDLRVILAKYREKVEATISLTARGGESLVTLIKCETILEGAITGWIAQMQGYNLHTSGAFPMIYADTETRSAGTRFSEDVRQFIAERKGLIAYDKRDALSNGSTLMFAIAVTGLYERASLNGDKPTAPVAEVIYFSTPKSPRRQEKESTAKDTASAPPSSPKPPAYYIGKIDDGDNPLAEKGDGEKIKKPMLGKF